MKVNAEFSHTMVAMVHFLLIFHAEGLEPQKLFWTTDTTKGMDSS